MQWCWCTFEFSRFGSRCVGTTTGVLARAFCKLTRVALSSSSLSSWRIVAGCNGHFGDVSLGLAVVVAALVILEVE